MKKNHLIFIHIVVYVYSSIILFYFPQINSDTAIQIAQSVSYIQGNGFTQGEARTGNFENIIFYQDKTFAPGVQYVLATLLHFFSFEISIWIAACIALLISWQCAFFLFSSFFPVYKPMHIWIFTTFFLLSPMLFQFSGLSDLFSLGFFLLSTVFSVRIITKQEKNQTKCILWALGLGFSAYLTCLFRYAYYFFFFIPIIVLAIYALVDKKIWLFVLIALLTCTTFLTLQYLHYSGSDYIQARHQQDRVLYWQDIPLITNFAADSFFETKLITNLGAKIVGYIHIILNVLVQGFYILAIITMTFSVFKRKIQYIKANTSWHERIVNKDSLFFIYTSITILLNVFVIIALTVYLGRVGVNDHFWTYVQEKRYFVLCAFCFWLIVCIGSQYSTKHFVISLVITFMTLFGGIIHISSKLKNYYMNNDLISMYEMSKDLYHRKDRKSIFVVPTGGGNYGDFASMGGAYLCNIDTITNIHQIKQLNRYADIYIPVPSQLTQQEKSKFEQLVKSTNAKLWRKVKTYGTTSVYKVSLKSLDHL